MRGYTFPAADFSIKSKNVESFLYDISPIIKIVSINTQAISKDTFNNIVKALSDSIYSRNLNMSDGANGMDKYFSSIEKSLMVPSRTPLPSSINLFFNTIINNAEDEIELVITSSPQIKVDLTKGWKTNQSIFNFLKEMIGNNPLTALFGEAGAKVNNIFSTGASFVQSGMHMTGRDIQIGPYWSFSNSPLSNYPEFSMETILINDTIDHYEANRKIVECLTMKYLPTTEEGSNYRLKPPYLFNIEIGVNFGFIKKIYFCKATFNVIETGRYFIVKDEKIPEFFKVTCHFTSLLPDMQNLSSEYFSYQGGGGNIGYKQVTFKPMEDIQKENPKLSKEELALIRGGQLAKQNSSLYQGIDPRIAAILASRGIDNPETIDYYRRLHPDIPKNLNIQQPQKTK